MVRSQRPALFLTLPAARPVREDFANAATALPRESPYISQHAAGVVIISGKLTLSRVLSLNEPHDDDFHQLYHVTVQLYQVSSLVSFIAAASVMFE